MDSQLQSNSTVLLSKLALSFMQSRFHQSWSHVYNHPSVQAFNPGFQRAMWHGYHRRGPSRLLWFLIGGGVFAWWHHHNERKQAIMEGKVPEQQWGQQWGWHGCGKWGNPRWQENGNQQQQAQNAAAPVGAAAPVPAIAVDVKTTPTPTTQQPEAWQAEREKIRQVGQQSVEAASDIAELSLDGVLSAVEGLRAKLAEFRQQREQQRARSQSEPPKPAEPEHRI